ncbi:MAG TPA: RHS repeat-associated core domain-containing protein [Mariniphaga sp.]|nr:RHS repeat-associated core domain-containing protein [Mariniphaga sp.]
MLISDRDTLQFSGFSYAPAVRIYTNDPDTIRIGCDVSIAGIITAPHATVQFFSRSQCDGAIYAREVIVEPETEVYSVLVNINEDSDTNGVSNGIEIYGPYPTNPLDPNDYMDYVIPSVTAIDYSVENNISLDYKFFYGEHYPESDSVPFKIDANVLKGIIAPLFQMRSFPEGFTELPDIAGYSPIGLCMNFAQVQFDTVSAGELTVPLPFPAGVFVEGDINVLVVKKDDTHEVVTPSSIKTGYVEVVVDSDVKSIMLLRKTKNLNRAVAYLDGGMIYSRGNHARVRTDIALTGADSLSSGTFTVYYTGYTGTVTVDTFKTVSLRNIETNGSYVLGTVDEISMQNPIMVKKVRLQIPSDSIDLIQDSLTWAVNQEECLKITIKEGLSGFNSVPEPITTSYISSFSLESVSIGGDGRIFQTYGDSGIEYSYDFYLKDHLGSTRMVINSQDQITEAVAYQGYGAMDPLDSIANAPEIPAREKFTGKEFDQEGEDSANGVVGIQAYHFGARVYDPEVGVWLSVDPAEQDFFVYGYCNGNPIIFVNPNGENWIGAIIGAAIGGTIGGIAAYNASDGHAGATMAGILVGGVWGGALGSMAGSGISGAAGAGGAATAGSAGAGTGIGAAGASLLRAGTVASQIFSNISAHRYSNNMLQVAGDGVVPATRMPGWVTERGTPSLFEVDWSKEGYYGLPSPLLANGGRGYFIEKIFVLKTPDRMNPLNFLSGTPASNHWEAIAAVTEYLSQVPSMITDETKRYHGSIVLEQYYLNGRATNWTVKEYGKKGLLSQSDAKWWSESYFRRKQYGF